MKNTIEGNLEAWDKEHHWAKDGDEWDGQARFSGVSYEDWKDSLIETFILPYVTADTSVLEIAPGHGRWSEIIARHSRALTLVDLSPSCIDYCKQRLAAYDHIAYLTTDGKSLAGVDDHSIDFLWSFDSFVHMSPDVIGAYLVEAARILRPGGKAVLHHAGRRNATLWLGFLKDWGEAGRNLYKLISMGKWGDDDGWRSDVSGQLVAELARNAGLVVESQVRKWGANEAYGVHRYGDWMTTLARP